MNRFIIREIGKKYGPISTNIFDLDAIKEDIELLHYYDSKLKEKSKYEVYDTIFKTVIWEEK